MTLTKGLNLSEPWFFFFKMRFALDVTLGLRHLSKSMLLRMIEEKMFWGGLGITEGRKELLFAKRGSEKTSIPSSL